MVPGVEEIDAESALTPGCRICWKRDIIGVGAGKCWGYE